MRQNVMAGKNEPLSFLLNTRVFAVIVLILAGLLYVRLGWAQEPLRTREDLQTLQRAASDPVELLRTQNLGMPVPYAFYALQRQMWRFSQSNKLSDLILLSHVVSVILHAINTILVFVLFDRLQSFRWAALIGALLFLVHPVHVQAVAWLSRQETLLGTLLFLLLLLAHIRSSQSSTAAFSLVQSWFLYVLVMFTHPLGFVAAPILCFVYDLWWARKSPLAALGRVAVYLGIAVGLFVVMNPPINTQGFDGMAALSLIGNVLWGQMSALFVPFNLNTFYLYPTGFEFLPLIGLVVFLALVVLLLWLQPVGRPITALGVVWLLVLVLPITIFPYSDTLRADHHIYAASIGVCILIGRGFWVLWERLQPFRFAVFAVFAVLMMVLSVLTVLRVGVWENDLTVWQDHLSDYPDSEVGALGVAAYYLERINPQADEAANLQNRALRSHSGRIW
jgi:protein O-mannosyl-transferase